MKRTNLLPLLAGAVVAAQSLATFPLAAQDTFELVELAPNVHVALVTPNPPRYVFANALVVIREHDVVVVDTHQSPSAAQVLIDEIARLTPLPVRYVVNTHWHGDHVYGNQSYAERFPDVEFVGHVNTRDDVESKASEAVREEIESLPASITAREEWIRTGVGPGGQLLTEEQVEQVRRSARLRSEYLEELKGVRLIPPDVTFDDRLVLDDPSVPVELYYFGPAHTRGDVVVYLPTQKILAVGDLLENALPWVDENSTPAGWAQVLERVSELDVDLLVPAHGPVLRDRVLLAGELDFMQAAATVARRAIESGLTMEETLEGLDYSEFRWFLDPEDPRRDAPFAEYVRTVVTRAYEVAAARR